ncbi:hypothetical protein RND81_05G012000 [Saponaria officinalis]|uniref:DUF4371 domain-containing protein n=1 Tax=Saponaria officinalis TaxID=3572 RepID=A0AAW1KPT8_SAPOF
MHPKTRKYESGYEKRKKKKRIDELTRFQRGALDKFIIKEVKNNTAVNLNENGNIDYIDDDTILADETNGEHSKHDKNDDDISNVSAAPSKSDEKNVNNIDDVNSVENVNVNLEGDIFDPHDLAVKGPKRDLSIENLYFNRVVTENGPKDGLKRHFSSNFYTRVLPRFNDWSHLSGRFKEHEMSVEHVKNMTIWYELRLRLGKNKAIDELNKKQLYKEKEHRKNVMVRMISIVKFLGKHNLAFHGTNEKLYQNSNGKFLGLVEMLAEFDLVIQHVSHITNTDTYRHYLGHNIQNELISLLASNLKFEIIKNIKQANHKEQMSIILRYVDTSLDEFRVEESFLGFLIVNDTSGLGLFNVLKNELKSLDPEIDNIRGQGYDNGSNMKGKHQGMQKRFLDINPRAFYAPFGCHSLNLALCDIANTCTKARNFFGTIQRVYTIFAHSTKRWQILKDNVPGMTPKPLSATRWESRIDSVKAIRFQMSEIREALLQVGEIDNDCKIRSEVKSLAINEVGNFEFLVSIVIWHKILYFVNEVSKNLQLKNMLIDVAILQVKALISTFEKYLESGFSKSVETAKHMADELDVDCVFPKRREIRRKGQFDENVDDSPSLSEEESFRVNYFLFPIDQAISLLKTRFEQYQEFESIFGFMFTTEKLSSLDDLILESCCLNLENTFKNNDQSDIDGYALYLDLKFFREFMPEENMGPLAILNHMKNAGGCFPNAVIAYRILLTIPMTVATAE